MRKRENWSQIELLPEMKRFERYDGGAGIIIRVMPSGSDPIQVDDTSTTVDAQDRRVKIEEPPPVRLVAVDDCFLWAPAGLERALDGFYVGILNLERLESEAGDGPHELIYRAENFKLRIEIVERPLAREDFRPLTLVVMSLNDLAGKLAEAEIEYVRERGLVPGHDNILLSDPAGNPVAVGEYRIAI